MDQADLQSLVQACVRPDGAQAPEKLWLREICAQRYESWGAAPMREGDALLFERVFGRAAATSSDILKVRY